MCVVIGQISETYWNKAHEIYQIFSFSSSIVGVVKAYRAGSFCNWRHFLWKEGENKFCLETEEMGRHDEKCDLEHERICVAE